MNAPEDEEFRGFVAARGLALLCTAYLLTGDRPLAGTGHQPRPAGQRSPPPAGVRPLGWAGMRVVWLAGDYGEQSLVTVEPDGTDPRTWMRFDVGGRPVEAVQWSRHLSGYGTE